MDRRIREEQIDPGVVDLKVDTSPGVNLRPRRARRHSTLGGAVNWNMVGVSGALLLLAGLHFSERIRIPGLEHLTYARMFAAPEPVRVVRKTPPRTTTSTLSSKPQPDLVRRGDPAQLTLKTLPRVVQTPAPAPQQTAALDPVQFLQDEGIVKKDGKFVLESESNIDACLRGIGEQAKRFNLAFQQLGAAQANLVDLRYVQETIIDIDQQVAWYDGEMGKYNVVCRWGTPWAGTTAEDNARYHQLKAERGELLARRNQQLNPFRQRLHLTEPGRVLDRATREFRERADETGRHLQSGRQVVERISSECERLAADPEVRSALQKVGQSSLELSSDYRAKSKQFWIAQSDYEKCLSVAGN